VCADAILRLRGMGLFLAMLRGGRMRPILACGFALWAMTSVDCVWIPHQSTRDSSRKSRRIARQARFAEAAAVLKAASAEKPENDGLKSLLADYVDAIGTWKALWKTHRKFCGGRPKKRGGAVGARCSGGRRGQAEAAMEDYRRLAELAPGQSYAGNS